jgi:hypothetical protein
MMWMEKNIRTYTCGPSPNRMRGLTSRAAPRKKSSTGRVNELCFTLRYWPLVQTSGSSWGSNAYRETGGLGRWACRSCRGPGNGHHVRTRARLAIAGPRFHQPAPLFECISAPIGTLDGVAGGVRQRSLGDLSREMCRIARPIPESRSKSVQCRRGA